MKSLHLQTLLRPWRVFLGVCFLVLLLFTSSPAYSSPKSDLTKGEVNMSNIEKKSEAAAKSDPFNLEKTQNEANKGINGIQGDADKNKMKNPGNTKGALSIEQKVKKVLEKSQDTAKDVIEKSQDTAKNVMEKSQDTAKDVIEKSQEAAKDPLKAVKKLIK